METFEDRIGTLYNGSPESQGENEEASAMSLLLAELISLNKARGERQKDQKAVVCGIYILTVVSAIP